MVFFDSIFGISKQSFLQNNVVSARGNDKFNNNKCLVCWDSYNEDHPGVRILPCNHVFGRDCLQQLINGPDGYECPLCHVALFRPPADAIIGRLCANLFDPLVIKLLRIQHQLWHVIPERMRIAIVLSLDLNNPLFWAMKIASAFVTFWERCPQLDLESDAALLTASHCMPYLAFYTMFTLTGDDFKSYLEVAVFSELCATAIEMGAVIWHLLGLLKAFERRQDWTFFMLTTVAAFCLKLGVVYLSFFCFSSDFLQRWLQNTSITAWKNAGNDVLVRYECEVASGNPFLQHSFVPIMGIQTLQTQIENSCTLVGVWNHQPVWIECKIPHSVSLDDVPR